MNRVPSNQSELGAGTSSAQERLFGGSQGRIKIELSASESGMRREGKLVRIVTLTVPTLSLVDLVLTESQKWSSLIDRQILTEDGPWRGTDMTVAWELYFQAQGLAPGAQCERGAARPRSHTLL